MNVSWIETVRGPVDVEELGLVLPHEHLFTDLRGPLVPDYAQADPEFVLQVMKPYLAEAEAAGVTAIVECSTVGVGRNIVVLQRLAEATPIHIVAPTGVYRDAYIPPSMRESSAEELAELWVRELDEGIAETGVKAGFIKIAMSDDGPTALEIRNLQAAALAGKKTGAAVASHTIGGEIARQEMDVLESYGLDLQRFIWVHANFELDLAVLIEAAQRGVFVEFDAIGSSWQSLDIQLDNAVALIEAGYAENILLSHDAGWYNPAQPDGQPEEGGIRGYTALMAGFLPALRSQGVSEEIIHLITVKNPAKAFGIAA